MAGRTRSGDERAGGPERDEQLAREEDEDRHYYTACNTRQICTTRSQKREAQR